MTQDQIKELWMIVEELKSWGGLLCKGGDFDVAQEELNGLGLRLRTIAKQLEFLKDEIESL